MSKREIYEQKTEEILNPIMEELEFELVDVEYVKEGSMWYLRNYSERLRSCKPQIIRYFR